MRADPAETEDEAPLHCATIVVRNAVTKLDALTVVALVLDERVERPRTARPFIRVGADAWAEIEIPKFGEPPPLAIDVYSRTSGEHARSAALSLLGRLRQQTAWNVVPDFPL